ncbi:ABC transporter substrate-binding protein [Arthrobacter sp. PGP41]|uniref:sugar ABC transporter substrate-binding protein n=1 Tax=unclassified Arthrobacter TaxID=235627 RepID=UPI000CDBDC8F|nr:MULTISPECIES: extracellular solute-binding protein [unclassified Arthrobacter]AUZ33086.1 ABC transporter substrate-binding protein [Arthrobacter sp. PGP41]MDT0197348.1 extracellular solute-binding protein [Arthrobacter sp. AB6]
MMTALHPAQKQKASRVLAGAVTALATLALVGCGSGFSGGGAGGSETPGAGGPLNVLIASSGEAESTAVKTAVADWSAGAGTEATVNVASDLPQQLSQGFASGKPADVFYVSADQLANYAGNGSLEPYGDALANKDDFYPALTEAFTYDGKLYCAPKDFSTLGLVINRDLWSQAGLTEADVPRTWEQLEAAAAKLTRDGTVGLAFGPEYQRVGAFFAQAGGGLAKDGKASANSGENVEALGFVKKMMNDGVAKFSSELGAGWGGEAFGKGQAAMVIEGNWIQGALDKDYPAINYQVAELPEGPGGKGTLTFTNCWGIAADSKNKDAARKLVEQLTSKESQLAFSAAFGVMPSIKSAREEWTAAFPALAPFMAGADYAQTTPLQQGAADVLADFNAQLEQLKDKEPKAILDSTQDSLEPVLEGAK